MINVIQASSVKRPFGTAMKADLKVDRFLQSMVIFSPCLRISMLFREKVSFKKAFNAVCLNKT